MVSRYLKTTFVTKKMTFVNGKLKPSEKNASLHTSKEREVAKKSDDGQMTAHNLRFGATAAEARMNWLWKFELLCAAELSLETAAAPSRCVVVGKRRECGEKAVTRESYAQAESASGEFAEKKEEQLNLYKNWARHSRSRKSGKKH
jgi:hypothetical protein